MMIFRTIINKLKGCANHIFNPALIYLKLQHIILLSIAGWWLLPACTSDDPEDDEAAQNTEMQFAISGVSRTSVTTKKDINTIGSRFAIYGEKMFQGQNDFHGPLVIFNNTEIELTKNGWNYGERQYWMPNHEYSFVTIYPTTDSIKYFSNIEYSNSRLSFSYSIPLSEGNTAVKEDYSDIIYATHRRLFETDASGYSKDDGIIRLQFDHLLSLLDITPAVVDPLMYTGDDESRLDPDPNFNDQIIKNEFIQFRKVEFYGFKTKADFSVTPAPLNTAKRTDDNDVTIDVDYSLPYANMTIEFTEETAQHIVNSDPNNVKNYSIFAENDALIMLPHTLAPDAKMHMTYTVNTDTPEDPVIRHITISLNGMKLERGKHYKLCFTIEKVYEGQIREGSLRWIVTDISDKSANDNWVGESDIIHQEFTVGDGQQ